MRSAVAVVCLLSAALALDPIKTTPADADALMDAGHFKQARALVAPRFRANPNDAETLYLEARIKTAFGDTDEAIKLAERALELNKNNVRYHGAVASLYGNKALQAGMFEQIILARKVKEHLESARALDPTNWQACAGLVQFYLLAPGIIGGDRQRAQVVADQAVKDDPAHGWMTQALIALHDKNTAKAEADYLNALKADPQSYNAMVALGTLYLQDTMKKYDLAEKYARAAIKVDPSRSTGYAVLAAQMVYTGKVNGDLDALLALAEKAAPDDWMPYYSAARTLIIVGKDFDRAERYLRKYLSQEPEGNAPKHAHAHWRLGQIYQKSGKKEQAIAEFETCLRAEPSFELAKKDLKALQ